MSKKNNKKYVCSECEYQSSLWVGKCSQCGQWNSFVESTILKLESSACVSGENETILIPKRLHEIEEANYLRVATCIDEFDRVVGGGLVPGSLILIGGEPGIGKSTLLTSVLGSLGETAKRPKVLYVSGEESSSQVAARARRLNCQSENLYICHQTSWQKTYSEIKKLKPDYLVIDSIQTTLSENLTSMAGSPSQIREVTYEILNYCKATLTTTFIVGHITKEGAIAGPKLLEHMVDTVIYFEGDQSGHYRILRSIKNRFGNTNEIGLFEMGEGGLKEVSNGSKYFIETDAEESCGRALTCVLEGTRVLMAEVQSLVIENKYGNGRRTTDGFDSGRLAMLTAIIEKFFSHQLGQSDIYLNIVGGIKLAQRESDLAVLASLLSSMRGVRTSRETVYMGEVGLSGEVRELLQSELRIKELEQLKYKRIVTSTRVARELKNKFKIEIVGLSKAHDLINYL